MVPPRVCSLDDLQQAFCDTFLGIELKKVRPQNMILNCLRCSVQNFQRVTPYFLSERPTQAFSVVEKLMLSTLQPLQNRLGGGVFQRLLAMIVHVANFAPNPRFEVKMPL